MKLPYLPDSHHVRALRLLEHAPKPFEPPAPGPCGVGWCLAMADKISGWPIEGPQLVTGNRVQLVGTHAYRCPVHRKYPDYRPHTRKVNLARVWANIDKPRRRRKAAA